MLELVKSRHRLSVAFRSGGQLLQPRRLCARKSISCCTWSVFYAEWGGGTGQSIHTKQVECARRQAYCFRCRRVRQFNDSIRATAAAAALARHCSGITRGAHVDANLSHHQQQQRQQQNQYDCASSWWWRRDLGVRLAWLVVLPRGSLSRCVRQLIYGMRGAWPKMCAPPHGHWQASSSNASDDDYESDVDDNDNRRRPNQISKAARLLYLPTMASVWPLFKDLPGMPRRTYLDAAAFRVESRRVRWSAISQNWDIELNRAEKFADAHNQSLIEFAEDCGGEPMEFEYIGNNGLIMCL